MNTPRAASASGAVAVAVSAAVADAVLEVPGVACLRPGLRSLLHTAARRPGTGPAAGADDRSGVHVTLGAAGTVTALHVEFVARAQHRAADVARAVRTAAAGTASVPRAAVKVTVTGVV
ncbi:Asp23/Gls24 family envelope stress response protein [Streptomyces sp. NPDC090077]|uniref:Asp23/Gls24 family envelope stress response protein n=1 Tax=Streptomyces sp. NPDC090077 TaxID=3365938 RepID=UPI0037F86587